MKITLDLSTDEAIALRRFMAEQGIPTPTLAAGAALLDWLIAMGYLELEDELDEDTETHGSA